MEEILLAQSLGADTTQEICLKGALKFEGNDKELTKAEKLIKSALSSASSENGPVIRG